MPLGERRLMSSNVELFRSHPLSSLCQGVLGRVEWTVVITNIPHFTELFFVMCEVLSHIFSRWDDLSICLPVI